MITVNDSHHVDKPAPTYRVRKEAMDAAVFELGPHARHGFEYTTIKCDGRWLWKPTDEVPAPTAAEIKANGGKRCLITQQKGTPMAIGPKLIVNATADDLQSREAMLRDMPPTCNGLDVAPTSLSPAAEQLGRMGFTDVAQNPSDGLSIPEFLQRGTPEAKERAKKAMKRIAKQVGPDRPIKNPPDAKAAERRAEKRKAPEAKFEGTPAYAQRKAKEKTLAKAKADSPKRVKRTSDAKTKTAWPSSHNRYDWKGAAEAAKAGKMPEAPDFSAPTHERFRPLLAEVVKAAKDGDLATLRKITINPISSSPKAIAKFRDLCLLALKDRGN
jgi:hypothetical protein